MENSFVNPCADSKCPSGRLTQYWIHLSAAILAAQRLRMVSLKIHRQPLAGRSWSFPCTDCWSHRQYMRIQTLASSSGHGQPLRPEYSAFPFSALPATVWCICRWLDIPTRPIWIVRGATSSRSLTTLSRYHGSALRFEPSAWNKSFPMSHSMGRTKFYIVFPDPLGTRSGCPNVIRWGKPPNWQCTRRLWWICKLKFEFIGVSVTFHNQNDKLKSQINPKSHQVAATIVPDKPEENWKLIEFTLNCRTEIFCGIYSWDTCRHLVASTRSCRTRDIPSYWIDTSPPHPHFFWNYFCDYTACNGRISRWESWNSKENSE